MKARTTIEEITHDDLVNLFSTALYGSSYLGAGYNYSFDLAEYDTHEDAIAAVLLKGRQIRVTDYYAEGSSYGNLPCEIDADEECATYTVTLEDIKNGLAKAADGTFNSRSECFVKDERRFARNSFDSFQSEACDFDLTYADCLMQIILFDEIIYG